MTALICPLHLSTVAGRLDAIHNLADHLADAATAPRSASPTVAELASLKTSDYAEAVASVLGLNGRYRDGDHSSAVIAGLVHRLATDPPIPSYVPAVADVLAVAAVVPGRHSAAERQEYAIRCLGGSY